jgi:hypothetical protein
VLLERTLQISPQGQFDGPGEKAGRAGDAAEGPQRTRPARQVRLAGLEPEVAGERGGEQEARVLEPVQEAVQWSGLFSGPGCSSIHRSHDHVDRAQDRHNVRHLVALEDVGQDLQVVLISGADLEPPGGDVVVALDEHADLSLA